MRLRVRFNRDGSVDIHSLAAELWNRQASRPGAADSLPVFRETLREALYQAWGDGAAHGVSDQSRGDPNFTPNPYAEEKP